MINKNFLSSIKTVSERIQKNKLEIDRNVMIEHDFSGCGSEFGGTPCVWTAVTSVEMLDFVSNNSCIQFGDRWHMKYSMPFWVQQNKTQLVTKAFEILPALVSYVNDREYHWGDCTVENISTPEMLQVFLKAGWDIESTFTKNRNSHQKNTLLSKAQINGQFALVKAIQEHKLQNVDSTESKCLQTTIRSIT
jgi:hypothetical protein